MPPPFMSGVAPSSLPASGHFCCLADLCGRGSAGGPSAEVKQPARGCGRSSAPLLPTPSIGLPFAVLGPQDGTLRTGPWSPGPFRVPAGEPCTFSLSLERSPDCRLRPDRCIHSVLCVHSWLSLLSFIHKQNALGIPRDALFPQPPATPPPGDIPL